MHVPSCCSCTVIQASKTYAASSRHLMNMKPLRQWTWCWQGRLHLPATFHNSASYFMVCAERAHAAGMLRRDQQGSFCIFCQLNKRNTALAVEVLLHCYHLIHWSHMYIFHTPAMKTSHILHFASCCIIVMSWWSVVTQRLSPKIFIWPGTTLNFCGIGELWKSC